MSIFHRIEIAPNLGRRGRTPIAALDPGMFRLRLAAPSTQGPITPPATAPAVEQQENTLDHQARHSVDPFTQPPPDWQSEPTPEPLSNVASPLERSLGDESASVDSPPLAEEVSPTPPLSRGETAIAPQEVASLDDPCATPPNDEVPTFAGQVLSSNGVPAAEPEVTRAPVRVIKLELESSADLADAPSASAADDTAPSEPKPAARADVSIAWPWQGDRDVAADHWRALLGLDADTSEAACVRVLCAMTIPLAAQAQNLGPALRAGYAAGEESRAIRASLLAVLADDPTCPPEFWWCVTSGSREPHERVLAYRALARRDARVYGQAFADPQAWVALALGRRLLREQGVHDFERALAALEPERATLLSSALIAT